MYAPTTIAAKEIITFLWDLFIIVKMINPNNSVNSTFCCHKLNKVPAQAKS